MKPSGPSAVASRMTRSASATAAATPASATRRTSASPWSSRETSALAVARPVEHQHEQVAAAPHRLGGLLGPADDQDGGVAGQLRRQLRDGLVAVELVGGAPRLDGRVIGRQHPRRDPPHRSVDRMALDQAPARGDERLRVDREPRERDRRLAPHQRRPRAAGPRHVAQPLDRVHSDPGQSPGFHTISAMKTTGQRVERPRGDADRLAAPFQLGHLRRRAAGAGAARRTGLELAHQADHGPHVRRAGCRARSRG